MQVLHPIIVHFPPVLWLVVLVAELTHEMDSGAQFDGRRVLIATAWLATVATLGSGLWDESAARLHLEQSWHLDDHRIAGIATTLTATLVSAGLLARRARWPTSARILLAALPAVAAWVTAWLGHSAIHKGPWIP